MLTALVFVAIVIYLIYLSNKISKLEVRLQQAQLRAAPAAKTSAEVQKPAVAPIAPSAYIAKPATMIAQAGSAAVAPAHAMDSESFTNALPKIGVAALVFGLAFFLKYAIDQGWISITLRLLIGGSVGTLLIILYYLWKDRYAKYSMALGGGGLAIWYLTIFAAVKMYAVLSVNSGMAILIVLSIICLYLAHKSKSTTLSGIAWGGAYISPLLLSLGWESYPTLLLYLGVVNIALLIYVYSSKVKNLFFLSLAGTGLNLLVVYTMQSITSETYYLHTLIFLLFNLVLNSVFVGLLINQGGLGLHDKDDGDFTASFGFIYLLFGLPLAIISYYHFPNIASLVLASIGLWTLIVYTIFDRLEYKNLNMVLSGIGAAALSVAAIWQFTGNVEILALYVLGLIGVVVGTIQKRFEIRSWGLVVVLLGIVYAIINPYPQFDSLFFSAKFGFELVGVLALMIAYQFYNEEGLSEFEHGIHRGLQYVMAGLIWFFVSWDLVNFFSGPNAINQRNLSLSIWWLAFAVILIAGSFIKSLKHLRKPSLILFGLVIIKVFLYDVQSLDTVYRIISFISLGIILLIVSFVYQHNKEKIKQYLE